ACVFERRRAAAVHVSVPLRARAVAPARRLFFAVADRLAHVLLQLAEVLLRVADAALERAVERVAAALDQVGEQPARHRALRALVVAADLRERDRRQR